MKKLMHAVLIACATLPSALSAQNRATPQYGTWGFGLEGMDRTVSPGDNFFLYANGTWFRTTEIPADRGSWGSGSILGELSNDRTRLIIEDAAANPGAPGSAAQKIGDYYRSFMDEKAIEANGIAPLRPFLGKIGAIANRSDLSRVIGELSVIGVTTPFSTNVDQDLRSNDRYAAYVSQDGLGLPDRDYYLDLKNAEFAKARARYKQHLATMLRFVGVSNAVTRANAVYALEEKIARVHWSAAEQRQLDKLYNPVTRAELNTKAPGMAWTPFLHATMLDGESRVIMLQASAISGEARLVANEPLAVWKDYLTFHTVARAASVLPRAFVQESFDFNQKTLAGIPSMSPRWKRGVEQVNGSLGEAVGQLYVARYFPPSAKAKADTLVRNLIAAMDVRLQNLEWMSAETKVKARKKLAAFTPKIGYPDKWTDYTSLAIVAGDPVGNLMRTSTFAHQTAVNRLGKPVDRSLWSMTPQEVNAYANPLLNEVVFPAAILQPPFFDPNADPAVNYGGIGSIIGHEITHHFDDQGSRFDPVGNMSDWWSATDVEKFKALTAQVVAQYHAYEPLPGIKLNGELTLGENMADNAGLIIAYDAYRLSLGGKPAPVIDGFTGDQRFFLGFAQNWRTKRRDALTQQLVASDPHSPPQFRVNAVRNFDAWYDAFNITSGALFISPSKRIRIW